MVSTGAGGPLRPLSAVTSGACTSRAAAESSRSATGRVLGSPDATTSVLATHPRMTSPRTPDISGPPSATTREATRPPSDLPPEEPIAGTTLPCGDDRSSAARLENARRITLASSMLREAEEEREPERTVGGVASGGHATAVEVDRKSFRHGDRREAAFVPPVMDAIRASTAARNAPCTEMTRSKGGQS